MILDFTSVNTASVRENVDDDISQNSNFSVPTGKREANCKLVWSFKEPIGADSWGREISADD